MTSLLRGLPLAAPFVVMLACVTDPAAPSLEDRVFLSQSVTEDGAPRALVAGTQLRLRFHEEGRLGASAGCNSLDARYTIDGDAFLVTDGAQTEIGCDAPLHEQDEWYFGFLLSSPTIVVDDDALVLEGAGTRIEYLDEEVATPDAELVGVTWTVETIIEGDAAQFTDWPSPATLVFAADGTVAVSAGCNGGGGTYQVSGSELTFADVAVTLRGCDSPTAELERAVLGVIHGPQPVTWEISVDRLSLRSADFGLDLVASDG